MERQVIKLVEQLVSKFKELEGLFTSKQFKELVYFYEEFNNDSSALPLLRYISENGDSNLVFYQAKQRKEPLTSEIQSREEHKYDLYQKFEDIVYKEDEFKVEAVGGGDGVTEIEWNEVEPEGEKADWEFVNKDSQDKKEEAPFVFNEEETLLYNQETRQLITNDLEELEFFMRQRLAELTSKD